MRKRICFFIGDMSQGGGTERMTQLLANTIALETNYDVYVLSKRAEKRNPFFDLNALIQYHILDGKKYNGCITIIKEIWLLRRFVKKHRIDILINVDVAIGITSLPLEFLYPKLKQIYWDNFSTQFKSEDGWDKWLMRTRRSAAKYGEAYVTLTPEDANNILRIAARSCHVLNIPNICPYPISTESYDAKAMSVISVGRLTKTKGFDYALEVAQRVFRKHPNWNWIFYGEGPEKTKLIEQAKSMGIDRQVRFMGQAKYLTAIYEHAAIYVLTSRTEGFGLVLIEAQAHHLPTVAFDVPYGPRNIIEDNVNGFLCKPFDIDEMADKICKLIENEEKRKAFSDKAQLNLDKFSAENVANKWKELLEKI